ncbi:MAG: hypothetical protein GY834_17185 [Bacteroidetes bacterium]|nr:hypothetical protein [Bacteroidota bacterium]
MTSQNRKKLALLVLLIPLVYIWGNNLSLFSSYSPSETVIKDTHSESNESNLSTQITYSVPKVNPFAKNIEPTATPKAKTKERNRNARTPRIPNQPSVNFSYIGFIEKPPHSQAVLKGTDESTMILELGDSLQSWKLIKITSASTVFQFETNRDTLILTK